MQPVIHRPRGVPPPNPDPHAPGPYAHGRNAPDPYASDPDWAAAYPPEPPHAAAPVRPDPAPSIWSYRAQRLLLTPLFHRLIRVGIPGFAIAFGVLWYASDDRNVQTLIDTAQQIRREVEDRPEFRVSLIDIRGASPDVTEDVRGALALDLPLSSFDLDLDTLRTRLLSLPAIAAADLHLRPGGLLEVTVSERVPALVWQTRNGMFLIDAEGAFVAGLAERPGAAALPSIAGAGADDAAPEALALFTAAAPLGARLQGLVRVGERRWDVVLRDGPRILLPEARPLQALDRVLALHDVRGILDRAAVRVDLRNPDRLTVQLTPEALAARRGLPLPASETETDAASASDPLQTLTGDQRG